MLVLGESIYVGNSAITQVYQGNNLIWPAETGVGYYCYYQASTDMSVEEALAAFENNRNIGPDASTANSFVFQIYPGGSAPQYGYVVCFAIPIQAGTLESVIADWSGQQDITSLFINSYNLVYIDNIPYKLYYHRALWRTFGNVTVVVSQNSN